MFNNFLNEILDFQKLSKEDKATFLYTKLSKIGYKPIKQSFSSAFGEGNNIIAFLGFDTSEVQTIISAHYDGDTLFDNTGGVFALLEISGRIINEKVEKNFCILFTDQEETFQQGVASFIKEFKPNISSLNINIDGFGIGDDVYLMSDNQFKNKEKEYYKTDMHKFDEYGIRGNSYFSSFKDDYNKINLSKESIKNIYLPYVDDTFFCNHFIQENYQKNIYSLCKSIYA